MDVIDQFYQAGDMLYAVTVINNIIERINNRIGSTLPPSQKELRNQCSALKKLRVFLHSKKPVGGINQQIKYQKYECKKVAHVAKNQ